VFTSTRLPLPRQQPFIAAAVAPLAGRALFALVLFVLAAGLRWPALDADVTHDEDQWIERAGNFARALRQGALSRTYQSGHPGVLTMELAILGQGLERAAGFADTASRADLVSATPGYFEALLAARRSFVLTSAGLVVAISLVTWRLLGAGPAIGGGLLLALDPFLLGHARVVQMDGLLSGLMVLATLCGLVRWADGGGRGWLLAGGSLSGLAALTKAPAIYLLLFIPLLAFAFRRGRGASGLLADLALWGAAGLIAALALWPALWVDAPGVATRIVSFAGDTGSRPHAQGNFFFGRPVADPGAFFYPLSALYRLTPAAMLGLLALALLGWRSSTARDLVRWPIVFALTAYVIGFGLFVGLAQKKFDRYLLPAYPALDLLAGLGLWLGFAVWRTSATWGRREAATGLMIAALAAILIWPLASVFPHFLTYYNPLLGGGPAATRIMLVGYGEGLVDAARWLNSRPNAERLTVAADSHDVLQAAFVGRVVPLGDRPPESADYVVIYHYQRQIRLRPRVLTAFDQRQPEQVIRLNGIEYARIYRGPQS
jgi:hypothetical protein